MKEPTTGEMVAIRFAKFPDGRIVYGPMHAEDLAAAIDAAIAEAVAEEREQCALIVGCLHVVGSASRKMQGEVEFAHRAMEAIRARGTT